MDSKYSPSRSSILPPTRRMFNAQFTQLGDELCKAAQSGNKRLLKKFVIERGVHVDRRNSRGETSLMIACRNRQKYVVIFLLKSGANPNERSNIGHTAVHEACRAGSLSILRQVVEAGGDVRLHDVWGKAPFHYIEDQDDPEKRKKIQKFLIDLKYSAIGGAPRLQSSNPPRSSKDSLASIHSSKPPTSGIFKKNSRSSIKAQWIESLGYGQFYFGHDASPSVVSSVPLVHFDCLQHDELGPTFESGHLMVMESMLWAHGVEDAATKVTVKRLHKQPRFGGVVDLLIHEVEVLSQIHHPNIVQLMGVSHKWGPDYDDINEGDAKVRPGDSLAGAGILDQMVVLQERVHRGSLFHIMHEKGSYPNMSDIMKILAQIAEALSFLHSRSVVHCYVNSHSIHMVNNFCAKLTNFEYAVNAKQRFNPSPSHSLTDNKESGSAYNWMAPELMRREEPTEAVDVYGFFVTVWEFFTGDIPWKTLDWKAIFNKVTNGGQLSLEAIPSAFISAIAKGIDPDPKKRAEHLPFRKVENLLKDWKKVAKLRVYDAESDDEKNENKKEEDIEDTKTHIKLIKHRTYTYKDGEIQRVGPVTPTPIFPAMSFADNYDHISRDLSKMEFVDISSDSPSYDVGGQDYGFDLTMSMSELTHSESDLDESERDTVQEDEIQSIHETTIQNQLVAEPILRPLNLPAEDTQLVSPPTRFKPETETEGDRRPQLIETSAAFESPNRQRRNRSSQGQREHPKEQRKKRSPNRNFENTLEYASEYDFESERKLPPKPPRNSTRQSRAVAPTAFETWRQIDRCSRSHSGSCTRLPVPYADISVATNVSSNSQLTSATSATKVSSLSSRREETNFGASDTMGVRSKSQATRVCNSSTSLPEKKNYSDENRGSFTRTISSQQSLLSSVTSDVTSGSSVSLGRDQRLFSYKKVSVKAEPSKNNDDGVAGGAMTSLPAPQPVRKKSSVKDLIAMYQSKDDIASEEQGVLLGELAAGKTKFWPAPSASSVNGVDGSATSCGSASTSRIPVAVQWTHPKFSPNGLPQTSSPEVITTPKGLSTSNLNASSPGLPTPPLPASQPPTNIASHFATDESLWTKPAFTVGDSGIPRQSRFVPRSTGQTAAGIEAVDSKGVAYKNVRPVPFKPIIPHPISRTSYHEFKKMMQEEEKKKVGDNQKEMDKRILTRDLHESKTAPAWSYDSRFRGKARNNLEDKENMTQTLSTPPTTTAAPPPATFCDLSSKKAEECDPPPLFFQMPTGGAEDEEERSTSRGSSFFSGVELKTNLDRKEGMTSTPVKNWPKVGRGDDFGKCDISFDSVVSELKRTVTVTPPMEDIQIHKAETFFSAERKTLTSTKASALNPADVGPSSACPQVAQANIPSPEMPPIESSESYSCSEDAYITCQEATMFSANAESTDALVRSVETVTSSEATDITAVFVGEKQRQPSPDVWGTGEGTRGDDDPEYDKNVYDKAIVQSCDPRVPSASTWSEDEWNRNSSDETRKVEVWNSQNQGDQEWNDEKMRDQDGDQDEKNNWELKTEEQDPFEKTESGQADEDWDEIEDENWETGYEDRQAEDWDESRIEGCDVEEARGEINRDEDVENRNDADWKLG